MIKSKKLEEKQVLEKKSEEVFFSNFSKLLATNKMKHQARASEIDAKSVTAALPKSLKAT